MLLRLPDDILVWDEQGECVYDEPDAPRVVLGLQDGILSATLIAPHTRPTFVKLSWTLTENEILPAPVKVLGDAWERGYGDLEWRAIDAARNMPWYMAISNGSDADPDRTGRRTACFGVKVRPSAFCQWQYDGATVTLTMDVRSGSHGVILGDRPLHMADIVFADYEDMTAFEGVCDFCRRMADGLVDLHLPETLCGFNDWYYAYGKNSAAHLLRDAEALSVLAQKSGCSPYMVIDDGWEPNACAGPWHTGNERFPDMRQLAADFSALGLRPGIWIRPLYQPTLCEAVPDEWRLIGNQSALDPSRPEVLAYVAEQLARLVDWGYRLIKYDFVTNDIFCHWGMEWTSFPESDAELTFYDSTRTTAEIIVELYRTIRTGAKDALLIGCNAVSHLCAGLVEINRTGDDTSGLEWARTKKMGVNTLAFRLPQHGAFYLADADCVGLTAKVPWSKNARWLQALSYSTTPLFVSWDQTFAPDGVTDALYDAFLCNTTNKIRPLPLDWMEEICPRRWQLGERELIFDWDAK